MRATTTCCIHVLYFFFNWTQSNKESIDVASERDRYLFRKKKKIGKYLYCHSVCRLRFG